MDDYTLVAYIGDHNIVEKREETLKQKRDKILGSLSMHANLQQMAKNRTNVSKISGVREIPGRGYNTISGITLSIKTDIFLQKLKPFSDFFAFRIQSLMWSKIILSHYLMLQGLCCHTSVAFLDWDCVYLPSLQCRQHRAINV